MGARGVADDVDDGAAAARLHQGIEGARHVDGAEHLQVPGCAPARLVDIEQRAGGDRAGIVDEDVDVREQPRKPCHVGAVAEIGRVGANRDVVASLDLRARDVEIGGATGHQHETAALGRKRLAHRAPDAARTAGDESELAAEIEVHGGLT